MTFTQKLICENLGINKKGHLTFASIDTGKLAKKYGTPLYVMDEDLIRKRCREYNTAVLKYFGGNGRVLFASKAAAFKSIYRIMDEENMWLDVVSAGEIYTAKKAGFPMEKTFFHGNNKTDEDIEFAIKYGVGTFVIDNMEEISALNKIAGTSGKKQDAILRLTPGIDPHTFEAVATGKVDSKFGFAIATGQAEQAVKEALHSENIKLLGYHCHVGSQVFESGVFKDAAEIMLDFFKQMEEKYAVGASELDLGGGYGVRYVEDEPCLNIDENIKDVASFISLKCEALGIKMPKISFEPGRSIVADAGLTLYTVGSNKNIPGFITYLAVDGGITDNVRYALYGSKYTVLPALRMKEEGDIVCTVAGRCCESGDIIQPGVSLPHGTSRGDIIAVCTTGAYNYSMASNYNRIPRPAVVMVRDGKSRIVVKRETLNDIIRLDK